MNTLPLDGDEDPGRADDEHRMDLTRYFNLADDIIDAGFAALPVWVFPKANGGLEKVPALPHGYLDATKDKGLIRQLLANPYRNPHDVPDHAELVIGFVPGSDGCGVLDCDVKDGKPGKETAGELQRQYGRFDGAAWKSVSGGINVLIRKPPGAHYGNHSPWKGIDIRADMGFVVAPGSRCRWGEWKWVRGGYGTPSPLPEGMAAQLHPSAAQHGRRATNAETIDFIEASPEVSSSKADELFGERLGVFKEAREGSRHQALLEVLGWAFGMKALDLRDAMSRVVEVWKVLVYDDPGRGSEPWEVAAWVVGQETKKRQEEADTPPSSPGAEAGDWRSLILDGRTWLRSGSPAIVSVWGDDNNALVPTRQPTLIVGENGSGKTTLAHHLMLGTIGLPGFGYVLGWPVRGRDEGQGVLYLAADRPDQARLSMLRYFYPVDGDGRGWELLGDDAEEWQLIADRLRVWQGPPPQSLARSPRLLLEMAEAAGAGLVVIDSAKDMAVQLSDDSVGAAVNQAHQYVVASGRDVVALHHPRKRGRDHASDRPTLDDVYGSTWLTAGAGSVLFLIEEPHTTEVLQLKTPNGQFANFRFQIDNTGRLTSVSGDGVTLVVRDGMPEGLSTKEITRRVTGIPDPSEAQVERIRRRLKVLEGAGVVHTVGAGSASRWVET